MRKNTKRKKKHKYKHIVLGKKKFYFYTIRWLDILGDSGHHDVESLKKMQPAKMVTQGYLFSKDKKLVKTFASYDESEATFSDVNVIPRGVVKKMTKIEL